MGLDTLRLNSICSKETRQIEKRVLDKGKQNNRKGIETLRIWKTTGNGAERTRELKLMVTVRVMTGSDNDDGDDGDDDDDAADADGTDNEDDDDHCRFDCRCRALPPAAPLPPACGP